jgi:hypothetical protein
MKRSWTALAVILVALTAVAGCNDYGNTFQNPNGASIVSLSPSQISAGSGDFTLSINGFGFVAKTVVQWNGKNLATTVPVDGNGNVLGTIVTAIVPAALIAKPGLASVNTLNPVSGTGRNGLSQSINFVINPLPNPVPAVSGISPNVSPNPQVNDIVVTIAGSSFLASTDPTQTSQVNLALGGTITKLPIGTISATQIQATIPKGTLINSSSSSVAALLTVFNPPSPPPTGCQISCNGGGGGGNSAAMNFTICAAGQTTCTALAPSSSAKIVEETPAVSLDGRYVAFTADQNGHSHIFLRDTCEGAAQACTPRTSLLSIASDGADADADSHSPAMSADGRFVAFSSSARNLVEGAQAGRQIYLRDTCVGAKSTCKSGTQLISTDSSGALVGIESILPSVSASGRFIAFLAITASHSPESAASGDQNSGFRQVFVRDTCLGEVNCIPKTTRISLQPGDGSGSTTKLAAPAMSGNARNVALSGGNTLMLFTRSVAVDDQVFVAAANAGPQK